MSIFKACDIRGVYGEELDEAIVERIGRAIGSLLAERYPHASPAVVVGGDVRTSTPALQEAVVSGLQASGRDVVDLGCVPTPLFYFAKQDLGTPGGIMVTASHNPPQFNGLKIALGDWPLTEEEIQAIRARVERGDFVTGQGQVRSGNLTEAYEHHLCAGSRPVAPEERPWRLVIDCGNGCFSEIAPRVARELGYEVVELFCEPDGTFPNRSPNSAVPENLAALGEKVQEVQAHLGVAFDGDGDRVAFVDERGEVVPGDVTAVLLARDFLARQPGGKVVHDLKCSQIVPEAVRAAGGVPLMEKSGHTFIKTRMIAEGAVLGAEASGHFFYEALHGGDDGLFSALRVAELVRAAGRSLGQLTETVPRFHTTPDLRVRFEGEEGLLDRLAQAFPPDRVSRLDGVRVQFDGGWGLVRRSVTEPAWTLRFEAQTADQLQDIIQAFLAPVPELRQALAAQGHRRSDGPRRRPAG